MFPTYDVGDRFIAEKLTFRERAPRAGDVIIFKPPPIEGYEQRSWFLSEDIFIKRVVGVAGDTLEVLFPCYPNGTVTLLLHQNMNFPPATALVNGTTSYPCPSRIFPPNSVGSPSSLGSGFQFVRSHKHEWLMQVCS